MAWRFHAIDATSWRLDGVEDNLAHWSISTQAPWYFSSKDLLETWETASGRPREEAYDSISMMNLREMVRGCVVSIRESVTGLTSRRWPRASEI